MKIMQYLKILILTVIYLISTRVIFRLMNMTEHKWIDIAFPWTPGIIMISTVSAALTLITLQLLNIKSSKEKEKNKHNIIANWLSLTIAILVTCLPIIYYYNFRIIDYTFLDELFEFFNIWHDWRVLPVIGGIWIGSSINKLLSS